MTTEPSSPTGLKYRQVQVDTLSKGRRGKHHDLVVGVVRELETLPFGEAMQISLADAGGIGLANLRAAVHRAAASRELQIGTRADDQNFYVWKKE